jgi:3-phytase
VVGITADTDSARSGTFGAHAVSTGAAAFVRTELPGPQNDIYFRTFVRVNSRSVNTIYIMRCRTEADTSILGIYITGSGKLGYRNDLTALTNTTAGVITDGTWHEIQVHVRVDGSAGLVEIWLDGIQVASSTEDLGATPAGIVQIGENGTGTRTFDIAFDDVTVATDFIGGGGQPTATRIPTSTPSPVSTIASPTPTFTPVPTATGTPNLTPLPTATGPAGSVTAVAVYAAVETDPMPNAGDSADDPAVWIHPTDPGKSTIIGTDKLGGLAVYDMSGSLLHYYPGTLPNNVDLRYNFPLGGNRVALVVATDKAIKPAVIRLYAVDPATRGLTSVEARTITSSISARGMCMYHSPVSGKYYVFANDNTNGTTEQWELYDNGSGLVDAKVVRKISVGSTTEGCAADDEAAAFYVAEEDVAIWRYSAEPTGGSTRTMVDAIDGTRVSPDVEGLAIYYGSGGAGYLLASDQSKSEYAVYERGGSNAFVGKFRIADGAIDSTFYTDGIDVTNFNLGGPFATGMFLAQDNTNNGGANQNFKLVPWSEIANKMSPPLIIDTRFDPRSIGAP